METGLAGIGRTPQACNSCRRRKTKCNGIKPACRTCVKRKQTCTWPNSLAPGGYRVDTPPRSDGSPRRRQGSEPTSMVVGLERPVADLPEPGLLRRLVEVFFTRHHDVELCSFLHKPSLDSSVRNPRVHFLLASIVALGALYISDSEAKNDFGFETGLQISEHYSQIARSFARERFDEPSVHTIQAMLILALHQLLTWQSIKAWMYTGIAIKMAQALRLGSEFNHRYSPKQKEVRRRTFWACFTMDRLVSFCTSRPTSIDTTTVRIQLPCPESVFAFGEPYTGPYLGGYLVPASQPSQANIAPLYVTAIRIWGDMCRLQMVLGRRRLKHLPTDSQGEFYQLTKAVENLCQSLPPSMRWSEYNYRLYQAVGQAQAFVNLHFLLYHAGCVMHQEYLPQLDVPINLTEETAPEAYDGAGQSLDHFDEKLIHVCMANANSITEMATVLYNGSSQEKQILQSTFAANALMTAGSVHLWAQYTHMADTDGHFPPDYKAKSRKLLYILRSWQGQWKVAGAWSETLEMLSKLYDFAYGSSEETEPWYWEGTPQDNPDLVLVDEVEMENQSHPGICEGDGLPDPAALCQRLIEKVRTVMLIPLEATDVKKRNLRTFIRTLSQHMWGSEVLQRIGDSFGNLESDTGSETATFGPEEFSVDGLLHDPFYATNVAQDLFPTDEALQDRFYAN